MKMYSCFIVMAILAILLTLHSGLVRSDEIDIKVLQGRRWGIETAHKYMDTFGVVRGCNYLPRFDHNSNEWPLTFKPKLYEQELGWAEGIGLNSIRFMVPFFAYQDDRKGLFDKLNTILDISANHHISVMLCLTCGRVKTDDAPLQLGPVRIRQAVHIQPFHIQGTRRRERKDWPQIKEFYQAILKRYAQDRRIILWDLYNEAKPKERPLVEFLFAAARDVDHTQPLSACWQAHDLSDVITFHTYAHPLSQGFRNELNKAKAYGRPMLCTEFLARNFGNTLESVLPTFAVEHVGWYVWGLCAGSSQTRFPWRWPEGSPEPYEWFHNLVYPDGHPYRAGEIELIKMFSYLD